jgi:hypothetical protein
MKPIIIVFFKSKNAEDRYEMSIFLSEHVAFC